MPIQNIQGLKGLTSADRADWEKEQLSLNSDFKNYSDARKDRLYRNQQFRTAFGGREDYASLKTMSASERDRFFADNAFISMYGDNITEEQMQAITPEQRDRFYNTAYALEQAKSLYGDTDVWNKIVDIHGMPILEYETIQDLLNSGIKPDSEVLDYEKFGKLGYLYNHGQKIIADSDLALMSGTSIADNSTAKRVFSRISKATKGAVQGVGEVVFGAPIDALKDLIGMGGDLYHSVITGDFNINTPTNLVNEQGAVNAIIRGFDTGEAKEREWLRASNDNIWAELISKDTERKLLRGQEQVSAIVNNLSEYKNDADGVRQINDYFENTLGLLPHYREFKDTKYIRNMSLDDKIQMLAESSYILETLGEPKYIELYDAKMKKYISDNIPFAVRAGHDASDVGIQVLGGVAGIFVGQGSLGTAIADAFSDYDSNAYRQGFSSDGEQLSWIINPVYWNSVSQYGTLSWPEIKRIKYGIGSDEYKTFATQYRDNNPLASDKEIETSYIQKQWDEGFFRGDQISRHMNVYDPTTETDAIGWHTLDGAIGMSGQVLSQYLLHKGVTGIGKGFKAAAESTLKGPKGYKVGAVLDKTTAGAGIIMPTIPIAESYAQGAYEKSILQNRDALESYLSSPEVQKNITDLYLQNEDEYLNRARRLLLSQSPTEAMTIGNNVTPQLQALARSIAEEDVRSDWYGHLDDNAKYAFWTSFGLEAMRYGMFNMFNRQWIFGDASKKLRGVKPDYKIRGIGAEPAVKGAWETTKDVSKNLAKEMWNSGKTNYCDELTTGFAVGVGTHMPNDYIGKLYGVNPDIDGIYGALMNGLNDMVETADDASSIQAFTTGALGFLVGGNVANVATSWAMPSIRAQYSDAEKADRIMRGLSPDMTTEEAREMFKQKLGLTENEYSKGRIALEWASYLTGNSALLNVSQRLQELDDATRIANRINAQLALDEEALNTDKVIRQIGSLIQAREAAVLSGNEMSMKDANYMDVFHTLHTLNNMREAGTDATSVYSNFFMTMQAYADGRIIDDDISAFLNNPEMSAYTQQMSSDEANAYATERLQKNASKFLEVANSWERNKSIIDKSIGDLSKSQNEDMQDFYYDLLFKMSWGDDVASRLSSIEESISGSTESSNSSNRLIQHLIATKGGNYEFVNGTVESIDSHITELDTKIAEIKSKLKKSKRGSSSFLQLRKSLDEANAELSRFKKLQHKYKKQLKYYKTASQDSYVDEVDKRVISSDELLKLSPEERLFVFTNSDEFSDEQKVEIDKARTELLSKFGNEYLETLRDSYILSDRKALNDEYIAKSLSGDFADAIYSVQYAKRNAALNTALWLGKEKVKSLLPMIGNKVTKKLISAVVGMPYDDVIQSAEIMLKDPNKIKVLKDAVIAAQNLQYIDYAIEQLDLRKADKKKAVNMFLNTFLQNIKLGNDVSFVDSLIKAGEAITSPSDFALYSKVIDKVVELLNQKNSSSETKVNEEVEKNEVGKTPKTPSSAVEAAELNEADLTTGEFKSLTPDQLAAADPQTFSPAKVPVQPQSDEVLPTNTQGTSMQGNWINAYDVKVLKETGKQVAKRGKADGDSFNRWLQWTADNGIRYQDVVDFELAKILEHNPNMPIHMITINAQDNATQDNLIGDAVMLAVEATDAVKRVHNEEYGHYITSRGKEYLIIGRAGVERTATDEQQNTYNNMYNDLKSEATAYFNEHGEERFCVSDKYHTEVRYVNGGSITTALLGEQAATHDITEMLGDAKRDPFGIKKIDNLGWYVQVGDKACEPFGLPSKVVREGRYYTPNNPANNRGAVFVMVPAGNGKFMPVKVTAALLTNIKDGALKRQIQNSLQKIVSPTYNVRQEGIMELLKTLVLNDNTNILIGTQDFNTVTIVNDSQKVSYDLATTPADELMAAIMQIPFRINVNQSVFLDATKLKQYAEAGVFRTDAAVLGATGNNYSVYTCNIDGTPAKENAPVGNDEYTPSTAETPSVIFNGNVARYRNGQWVVEDIVNGTRTVTSPAEIQQLNYSWQIIQQGLAPVETDAKTGFNYYIIDSNPNHPIAVKKDNAGKVVVASEEAARKLLEQAERKAKDKAAAAVLQAENDAAAKRGQVINLEEDEVTTPPVEIDNEAAAQKGQLFDLFEDETDVDQAPKVTSTKEKGGDDVTKTLLDLDMSGKSSTFAELFNSADHFEDIYNALVEKFGEENLPADVSQYEAFLKEHNIPTVVSSAEALIDMIKNCR